MFSADRGAVQHQAAAGITPNDHPRLRGQLKPGLLNAHSGYRRDGARIMENEPQPKTQLRIANMDHIPILEGVRLRGGDRLAVQISPVGASQIGEKVCAIFLLNLEVLPRDKIICVRHHQPGLWADADHRGLLAQHFDAALPVG